jgi:Zn-dependent proteases
MVPGVKWSFRMATVAGIEVRIHATFVLLLGLYAWMAYLAGRTPAEGLVLANTIVGLVLLLFLCVLLHEFGHAFAARAFGIRTPDITLLPIGGIARLERMPSSPWQELVIAVAGPAVNVVIVLLLLPFVGPPGSWSELRSIDLERGSMALNLLGLNVMLIVFNMLPAFPMDGGRVLRALLATRFRHSLATLVAARVGQGIAVVFVLAGLIWQGNLMLLIIGFFVFIGAQQELVYARMRESARQFRVGEIMRTRYATLPDSLPVGAVADALLGSNQAVFPLVGEDLAFRGLVTRDDLLDAARSRPPESPVADVGVAAATLYTDSGLEEAIEIMQKSQLPLLPVVNASGQLVGLVEIDQLMDLARGARPD